jgi:hypothetical protein
VQRELFLSLIDPTGREDSCQTLIVPVEAAQDRCRHWIPTIGATFNAEGVWMLRAHSGGFLLAEIDIPVLIAD